MKKLVSIVLALAMVALCIGAAVADPTYPTGTGSITVEHAANGETYYAIKALDATVSEDGIAYYGEIPEQLAGVLEVKDIVDGEKHYQAIGKKDGVSTADYDAAMRAFATAKQSSWGTGVVAANDKAVFNNLPWGFYVFVSTLTSGTQTTLTNKVMAGSTISATKPYTANGTVYEKNETIPQPEKTVGDTSYSIGETIPYTVTFPGANFMGEGEESKIVYQYEVKDTLPEFLSGAALQHVYIGTGDSRVDVVTDDMKTAFSSEKKFYIPWADGSHGNYTSKYANGTTVTIEYTAVLTSTVNVNAANTNTVTITPYVDTDNPGPWEENWSDDAEVTTYAAALKKTDGSKALAGAKFAFKGLTVVETAEGIYTVQSYDSSSEELGTVMTVGTDGKLYIVGLKKSVALTGKETEAPAGYNLLTSDVTLQPQVLEHEVYKASGTRKYDAKGNLIESSATATTTKDVEKNLSDLDPAAVEVINQAGTELPHTGGIGTTIFYILGGLLVVGAAVILIARRKAEE